MTALKQHRLNQLSGCGLAVCAGDGEPLGNLVGLVAQAPSKVNVDPNRDVVLCRPLDDWRIWAHTRRGHNHLRVKSNQFCWDTIVRGGCFAYQVVNANHIEDVEKVLLGLLGNHKLLGA